MFAVGVLGWLVAVSASVSDSDAVLPRHSSQYFYAKPNPTFISHRDPAARGQRGQTSDR